MGGWVRKRADPMFPPDGAVVLPARVGFRLSDQAFLSRPLASSGLRTVFTSWFSIYTFGVTWCDWHTLIIFWYSYDGNDDNLSKMSFWINSSVSDRESQYKQRKFYFFFQKMLRSCTVLDLSWMAINSKCESIGAEIFVRIYDTCR